MSLIANKLVYTTLFLTSENSTSTGFIFQRNGVLYLVTNRHCVDAPLIITNFHTKDSDGNLSNIYFQHAFSSNDFTFHPDDSIDVAIAPLNPALQSATSQGIKLHFEAIGETAIPTNLDETNYISHIEQVLFLGYPKGIYDNINNFPIVRKGITASPYKIDFNNCAFFLVDGSVFAGSSGSPVVIYNNGAYLDNNGVEYIGEKFYFLGILAGTYETEQYLIDTNTNTTLVGVKTKQNIDLGIAFKARKILETIDYSLITPQVKQ